MSIPNINNESDLLNYLLTKEQELKGDVSKKGKDIMSILIAYILENIREAMHPNEDPAERKKALDAIGKQMDDLMNSIDKDRQEYTQLKQFSDDLEQNPGDYLNILQQLQTYLATLGSQS